MDEKYVSIFADDNEDKLNVTAQAFIEGRKAQELLAKKDATQTPTPALMAAKLQISLEDYVELVEFVESGDYGEWAKDKLESMQRWTYDENGHITDPYNPKDY
jgi:hypothetical protein